jgi:hypothetical protein
MPSDGPDPLAESIHTHRTDIAAMISQVRERVQHRAGQVTLEALMADTEWKQNLLESLDPDVHPDDAARVIRLAAIYRDRWGIEDSPVPLGPVPAEYEWGL